MRCPFHGDNGAKWQLTLSGLLSSADSDVALIAELARVCATLFALDVGESYNSLQVLEMLSTGEYWLRFLFGFIQPLTTDSAMLLQLFGVILCRTDVQFCDNFNVVY